MVVDADKNDAVFAQQIAREKQARVEHVEPVAVIAAVAVFVGALREAFLADLAGVAQVVSQAFAEVVGVDEFVAGVVGRVDVDHLDLAVIRALQQLEHFEIVALDDEVGGSVPVDAFVRHRGEGAVRDALHVAEGVHLAGPGEAVALFALRQGAAECGFEFVEVDATLGEDMRHLCAQRGKKISGEIGRAGLKLGW